MYMYVWLRQSAQHGTTPPGRVVVVDAAAGKHIGIERRRFGIK